MKKSIKILFLITICLFFVNVKVTSAETTVCNSRLATVVCNLTNSDGDRFNVKACFDDNDKVSTVYFLASIDGKSYHYTNNDYNTIKSGLNGGGVFSNNVHTVYFSKKAAKNSIKMLKNYGSDFSKTSSYCPTDVYFTKKGSGQMCFGYSNEKYCKDKTKSWKNVYHFSEVLSDPFENLPSDMVDDMMKANANVQKQYDEGKLNFEKVTPVDCDSLLGTRTDTSTPAYYVHTGFVWIKYIAIIILIVLSMKDFGFAIISKDEEAIKKATSSTIKRFIYCIIIFVLPVLIELIMGWANIVSDPSVCGLS